MDSIAILSDTRASVSHFKKVKMTGSKIGISCDDSLVVGGTPTYTVLFCTFDGDEEQFRELSSETNLLALSESVKYSSFNFAYLGIKYTPNSATGEVQIYLNTAT